LYLYGVFHSHTLFQFTRKLVCICKRLGYGLDEEAVKAVAQMQFQPAMKQGQPVPFWVTLELEFYLK
jgi:hypothetical protein